MPVLSNRAPLLPQNNLIHPGSSGQTPSLEGYSKLPLSFTANQGQLDKAVRFSARGAGYDLNLAENELEFALNQVNHPDQSPAVVKMNWLGGNSHPFIEGESEQPGKVNFLIGNDPKQWRTGVSTFGRVQYREIYPGINLVFYGNQQQLEYDFVVAPEADPGQIRLQFEGASAIEINQGGDLVLQTQSGPLLQKAPQLYQEKDGHRELVKGSYHLYEQAGRLPTVGFSIKGYDPTRSLTIDPALAYASYTGGSSEDYGRAIALDSSGNSYILGETTSTNYPTLSAVQGSNAGSQDLFVTKLNPAGNGVLYSTYLGGSGYDYGRGLAVDANGSLYISGYTTSANFPVASAAQGSLNGTTDLFVARLNAAGNGLVFSTYLGSNGDDYKNSAGQNLTLDSSGNVYITGTTFDPSSFPADNWICPYNNGVPNCGQGAATVTKYSSTGSKLSSLVVGGSDFTNGNGLALDAQGYIYLVGRTSSQDIPFANPFKPGTSSGNYEAYIAKINIAAGSLAYLAYLTGSRDDEAFAVAVDSTSNAYLTGTTASQDFVTLNPLQGAPSNYCSQCVFVTKINSSGNGLVFSTYLGTGGNGVRAITLGGDGSIFVAGDAFNLPLAAPLSYGPYGGFASQLAPDGQSLRYSTYLKGVEPYGIAVINSGGKDYTYLTGEAPSSTILSGSSKSGPGGGTDTFVYKLGSYLDQVNTTTSLSTSANPMTYSQAVTLTATVSNNSGTVATGKVLFKDGTTILNSGNPVDLDNNGKAVLSSINSNFTSVTPGNHSLTAVYLGGPTFYGSNSTPLALTVNKITPVVTLTAQPNPSVQGQGILFTMNAANPPGYTTYFPGGGTFNLFQNGNLIYSAPANNNGFTGLAPYYLGTLSPGSYTFTTTYSGDADFASASSTPLVQVVNPDPVTMPWTVRNPLPVPYNLTSVTCPTAQTCYAAGEGNFLKSSDGGASWTIQYSYQGNPTYDTLSSGYNYISCTSATSCVVYTLDGLMVTSDGGANWFNRSVYYPKGIWGSGGVSCLSDGVCYSTAPDFGYPDQFLVRSTDAGQTWQQTGAKTTGGGPSNLQCLNDSTCVFNEEYFTNGSTTFTKINFPANVTLASDSCAGITPTTCFILGNDVNNNQFIYSTTDFGATWTLRHSETAVYNGPGVISCSTPARCLALYNGNHLLLTTDGGATWTIPALPFTNYINSLTCYGDGTSTCVMVGESGALITSSDGGATWTERAKNVAAGKNSANVVTSGEITDLTCPDSSTCFAISTLTKGLLYSQDAGQNWSIRTGNLAVNLASLSCPTSTTCLGVVSGNGGPIDPKVYKTTDAGQTWSTITVPVPANAGLKLINCPTTSFCLVSSTYQSTLYRTSDAGVSWSGPVSLGGSYVLLMRLSCKSSTLCFALGAGGFNDGTVWTSTNGFQTFTSYTNSPGYEFVDISCPTSGACFALGGSGLSKTTDGGQTWTKLNTPGLMARSISCSDGNNCIEVGDDCLSGGYSSCDLLTLNTTTALTTDEGQTWTKMPVTNHRGLDVVRFLTSGTMVAVGKNGIIMTQAGPPPPLTAPSNLAATVKSSSQITLNWTSNSSSESGFYVERKTGSGVYARVGTVGAGITTFIDTGLAASTTYFYRVQAYNSSSTSGYSNEASATTGGATPMPPTNLTVSLVVGTQISLNWTNPVPAGIGTHVERSTSANGPWSLIATIALSNATGFTDNNGLWPNTTYYYQVKAYNAAGDSAASNVVSATTQPLVSDYEVSEVTDTGNGATGTLSWALNQAASSATSASPKVITFKNGLTQVTVTGPLPAVPAWVTITGNSCASRVIIQGGAGSGDGLVLSNGRVTLLNLQISGFNGRELVLPKGGNHLNCLKVVH